MTNMKQYNLLNVTTGNLFLSTTTLDYAQAHAILHYLVTKDFYLEGELEIIEIPDVNK